MRRRDFIRSTISAAVIPAAINGLPLRAFVSAGPLAFMLGNAEENDHVLVIVQLNGGNDGLNTVIPVDGYSNYYNARSNIAISQGSILQLDGVTKTGLHPAMTGMRALYNDGRLGIVQAVGYPKPNFSHFRATDIWMSASESDQVLISGWIGRYLDSIYPDFPAGYPNTSMPDPLGIQIGSLTSMVFQGPEMSMGMSISDPANFYNLLSGVEDPAPDTFAGKELKYIRLVARQTSQYAGVVKNAALKVTSQVTYPSSNTLADQLKIVARLIKGGLKTKIYMVSYGGFDTHSSQVTAGDTSSGKHATLLKNVSDAIKAFQDDLKYLAVEERVMGITFSEFGRRIKSNNSNGTDHGSAAPLFVFGSSVNRTIHGTIPSLPSQATTNDNIPMQYDFRSVYASMLKDWLGVKSEDLQSIMLKNFQILPLLKSASAIDTPGESGRQLIDNYPNPFTGTTTIRYTTSGGHTLIQIFNSRGQAIDTILDEDNPVPGTYTVQWESGTAGPGIYYARFQNGTVQHVRPLMKVR